MLESSRNIAFEAMTEASEYGRIIQLCKDIISVNNTESLIKSIDNYFVELGIPYAIRLFDPREGYYYGLDQQPDIIRRLFEALENQGRLYAFNHRLLANGQNCAILIKRMPEDPIKAGRLRDTLATQIEIVEAKWKELQNSKFIAHIDQEIGRLSQTVSDSLASASDELTKVTGAFSEMLLGSFHILDLNEEQERYLIEQLDDLLSRMPIYQTFSQMDTMLKRLGMYLSEKRDGQTGNSTRH